MNLLSLFHLPTATMLALVVSVVIPAVTSLVGRAHWSGHVLGLVTLALATANGFFSEWAANPDFAWRAAVGTAILSYLIAVAARFGWLKDTPLDAQLLAVGSGTHANPAVITTVQAQPAVGAPVQPPTVS